MSYINEKEQMKNEANKHRRLVWTSIKITFITLAACLVLFFIALIISLIVGDNKKDTEAPTIIVPNNGIVVGYVGETPIYKQMVKVVDNIDESPKLYVNNKEVNMDRAGEYKVYFVAEDASGNRSKTYVVTYVVKSLEYSETKLMESIADEAQNAGITKNMTKRARVEKIYKRVQQLIKWEDGESGIGESNIPGIDRSKWQTDWVEEAVRSLESGVGDCYSYYSLSKAFFVYFNIEHEGIMRSEKAKLGDDGEEGTHFWLAVKIEEGWYYYDATPLAGEFSDGTRYSCLMTQAKLDSYVTSHGGTKFYLMDKKLTKISKTELD